MLCHALRAFLPDASARIADQLGIKAEGRLEAVLRWNAFAPGHTIVGPQPLFARLETGGA